MRATAGGRRPGRRQGRLVLADQRRGGGLDARRASTPSSTRWPPRTGAGREVVLVSSGAIAAGLAPLGLARRPRDLATQQAAASVGQGLLVHRYTEAFARHGLTVGQVLLTADDVVRRAHYRNAQRTLHRLLELGVVPVVNENDTVATDEIRFGDNDRLAALVAHLVRADLLVLLSDVDGLYDGDPRRTASRKIAEVRGDADLDGVRLGRAGGTASGTGGMATKVEAARIAAAAGVARGRDLGRRRPATCSPAPTSARCSTPAAVAAAHPAALARARDDPARPAAARRRRGPRGRRPAAVAARGGRDGGRGRLRRRRSGRPP